MAADQRRKRLNGASIVGYGSREQHRTKRKNLGLVQNDLSMKSHISVEWDASQKRVVAKREQIGISWRHMKPFISSVAKGHKVLADVFTIPQEIFDLDNLSEVLSYEVWKTHLSENERNLLMQFLPGGFEPHEIVEELLSGNNFHCGNPFLKWGASLCLGDLHPDMIVDREKHLKSEKKAYYSQLHNYHNDMIEFLIKLKERWQSCKDQEKEIVQKIQRSKNDVVKRLPSNVNEARVYDHDGNVTMTSESCSWDAEEKACSSDNQISSLIKDNKLKRRVLEKGIMKRNSRNLIVSSDDMLNVGETPKKGDKLPKRSIHSSDGDKYMSCIKISKQQHELVKSMKQSGKSIQSRSLNRVLGNLDNIHVQPYELFVKEEQKKLQEYWLQLVNKDLPAAYANRTDRQNQRLAARNSLVAEIKDKSNPLLEEDHDVRSGTEVQDQNEDNMNSGAEFQNQDEDNVSSEAEIQDQDEDNMSSGAVLQDQDEDNMSSGAVLQDQDEDHMSSGCELEDQDQYEDNISSGGTLQDQDQDEDHMSSGDELQDQDQDQDEDNVNSGSKLKDQDEDNVSSGNKLQDQAEDGDLNDQSCPNDEEDSIARSPENQSPHNSYTGHEELNPMITESGKNLVSSKSADVSTNKAEYSRNMNTQVVSVNEGASFASGSDAWQAVEMPHPYYDSAVTHEYTSSRLSLTNPQVNEQQTPLIDLQADLHQQETGKELLHRHSGDGTFSSYQSQGRSDYLQSLFKGEEMLSYQPERKAELDFQTSNNVMMGDGQFRSQFKEPSQTSLTLHPGQRRASEVYLPDNMSDNIYSDRGRYLMPRQDPLIPRQHPLAASQMTDWAADNVRIAAPSQSHFNTGNFIGNHWFPADHHVPGGWNGSDGSSLSSQSLGTGSNSDQSLFSVLSQCSQLRSGSSYDSVRTTGQFHAPRSYGEVDAGAPRINADTPQTSHALGYFSGREAPTGMVPDDMAWMSLPHQSSALHDQMGKPFLRSWNR